MFSLCVRVPMSVVVVVYVYVYVCVCVCVCMCVFAFECLYKMFGGYAQRNSQRPMVCLPT
jgi:hypothetical protein